MKALVVGLGSVGQVFAYYLKQSGAEVYFYVKEKHRNEAERGFKMFNWNSKRGGKPSELFLKADGVLSSADQLRDHSWDQVYFCMSSTGLRGDWLPGFLKAIGSATLVTLQPSLGDQDLILAHLPDAQLVSGVISFISYPAPLPGEALEAGTAFWIPPMTPNPFSGKSRERVLAVTEQLKKGGLPTKIESDVVRSHAFIGAALMVVVGVLETAGWKLSETKSGEKLKLLKGAAQAALASTEALYDAKAPLLLKLILSKPGLTLLTLFAPKLAPFDMETYLRVHFTKVGDQTRLALKQISENAKKKNVPVVKLDELIQVIS